MSKRRGLTAQDLERLLGEKFRKRLLVMLTKAEAATLLLALDRGSWPAEENAPGAPASDAYEPYQHGDSDEYESDEYAPGEYVPGEPEEEQYPESAYAA